MRAGLLGRKLGHSFSPRIHSFLGNYSYELFEIEPENLGAFLQGDGFDALNVTIPYKKDVIPYLAELSPAARAIGSVNTIVRRADGSLFGDNTDAAGFSGMVRRLCINPAGKKALILGSGGASLTAQYVLREMGASEVIVISRSGEDNYENMDRHADAHILVNATPVGMYPHNGISPVDLSRLPALEAVLDLIYNPARTQLLLDAQARGIPCINGLFMLAEQARKASERFTGASLDPALSEKVFGILRAETENIVLIGMPGCGKTTIGQILSEKTGKPVLDADAVLTEKVGMSIPEYFATHTEDEFRQVETEVLREICRMSGQIIATGGGCVTRSENRDLLRQNSRVFYIERSLELLPTDGRPLSQRGSLQEMYAKRHPLYINFADVRIANTDAPEASAEKIMEAFYENSGN